MDILISFIIGCASSLFVSYCLFLVGLFSRIVPPKCRKSFDREYKNQKKALRSIRKDAKSSSTLKVLAMKGDTFSNPGESGELHDLLLDGPSKQMYLISNPENTYVIQRGKELGNKNFKGGIENSIGCFNAVIANNDNIELKMHKEILRFRLIIFDNSIYLSFQSADTPGRLSPIQRYIKPSSGYSALEAYFDDLWKKYGN